MSDGHTCHLRQFGLKLGKPFKASRSDMKTYRVATSLVLGERAGSSLGGYVRRGNFLNSRASGAGIANQPDILYGFWFVVALGVFDDMVSNSVLSPFY